MREPAIDVSAISTGEASRVVASYVREITESADADGEIVFELSRFGIGKDGAIGEVQFDFGQDTGDLIEEIVQMAVAEALELVGSGKQKVKFTVRAIRNGKPIVRRETFSLALPETSEADEDEDFIEELPTPKGTLAMTMRHQEKVIRATIGPQQKIVEALQRDNRELREQNAALMRASMDQWKMFQELVDGKFQRDLEHKRFLNEERRKDDVAGMLIQGAPMLFNRFLGGGKTIAEPSTRIEQMVEGVLSTFTPEQFQAMASTGKIELSVMQRAALAEIAMAFVERKEAKEAKADPKPEDMNGAANGAHVTE